MSTLYIVATPIGNLEDITLRALRILRAAALIAAEDTRVTRRLLAHYEISTPLISYHEHNKLTRLSTIFETLQTGDVALVSDAGTPGINDPGYELVREAVAQGVDVVPVPGASAPIAALAASGLPTDRFLYLGFVPRAQGERRAFWEEAAEAPYTLIALEAPHRLRASLEDARRALGERDIVVAREITKLHEEIFRGTLSQAIEHFAAPRGEVTLVIAGAAKAGQRWTRPEVQQALAAAIAAGASPSEASRQVAAQSGWKRRAVYRLTLGDAPPEQDGADE
ncbi:MAG: 16S rRNA (cytidine(1402)-2'-O)-methyltransferase [Anaerolineae bacterium]|nr:16S rRNA (cytidine(1402)-2'-O)-methyltransferase [Anaerolineae bacterium]